MFSRSGFQTVWFGFFLRVSAFHGSLHSEFSRFARFLKVFRVFKFLGSREKKKKKVRRPSLPRRKKSTKKFRRLTDFAQNQVWPKFGQENFGQTGLCTCRSPNVAIPTPTKTAENGKKHEILGPPPSGRHPSGPHPSGSLHFCWGWTPHTQSPHPTRGQTFVGLAPRPPHLNRPHSDRRPPPPSLPDLLVNKTWSWPKLMLAKLCKNGLAKLWFWELFRAKWKRMTIVRIFAELPCLRETGQ